MRPLRLDECREAWATYFFTRACQFRTTVNGCVPCVAGGAGIRKRLPSALASQNTRPAGTLTYGLGMPAWKTPGLLMSTALALPSVDRSKISLPSRHPRGEPTSPFETSISSMRPERCWRASRRVDRTVAPRPRACVRSRRANDERTELRSGGPHGICALSGISPGGLQAAEFVPIEGAYVEAEQPRAPTQNVPTPQRKAAGAIQAKW